MTQNPTNSNSLYFKFYKLEATLENLQATNLITDKHTDLNLIDSNTVLNLTNYESPRIYSTNLNLP